MVNALTREFSSSSQRSEGKTRAAGFIVKGATGSGKSCLLRRLIVHTLNSGGDLFPIFISVTDFAQRITELIKGRIRQDNEVPLRSILRLEEMFIADEADEDNAVVVLPGNLSRGHMVPPKQNGTVNLGSVHLMQEYLKMLHGEESLRYILLKKAICSHRAIFLFDHDSSGAIPLII